MSETFEVHLTLTRDRPNSMNFIDIREGLDRVWYKFESDSGNIILSANPDGFEYLARYFLKMARTGKQAGYHCHHALEYGGTPNEEPELKIILSDAPAGFFGPDPSRSS
jgi:hypothetical protein